MDDDQPPPYTPAAEYAMKVNPEQQPQPAGPVSFIQQQDVSTFPHQGPPSAPPYEAVAYYPASASNVPVLQQPQTQQQQIIVVQSPAQVVVLPPPTAPAAGAVHQPAGKSYSKHICVSCLTFLCCWGCPCSIVAFILASKSTLYKHT